MSQNNEKPVSTQNTIITALIALIVGGGGTTAVSSAFQSKEPPSYVVKMQVNQENIMRTLSEMKSDNKKTLNSMILTIQSNKSDINDIKWQLKALKTASK